nr:hypothetical protein [Bradyrhizobium diversitatis]
MEYGLITAGIAFAIIGLPSRTPARH